MPKVKNILIVGTGGQGVILASDILSDVLGSNEQLQVKKSETHGMSQRGGSVHSQIRYGPEVHTPFVSPGEADIILAFEQAEGLRWSHYLADDGIMILNNENIIPPLAYAGLAKYPETGIKRLKNDKRVKEIDAYKIATEAGSIKVVSVVLLGAISELLDFDRYIWINILTKRVPEKMLQVNIVAFEEGRKAIASQTQQY
ncbi:MAG: indolepyruvate oxidoreductase subunit beta [Bacillota bacterium]|jgi:indolepyruvate ferredoxin oxidoreductase beta subunit